MTDLKAGAFSWVDLSAHDMNAAKKWYGDLFGWTAVDQDTQGGPPYAMCEDGSSAKMVTFSLRAPAQPRSPFRRESNLERTRKPACLSGAALGDDSTMGEGEGGGTHPVPRESRVSVTMISKGSAAGHPRTSIHEGEALGGVPVLLVIDIIRRGQAKRLIP